MSAEIATKNEFGMASVMSDDQLFDRMYRLSEVMASSKITVPKHLQGNAGDCMAIVMQAAQWKMNPFAVAQKTHIVSGNIGYEAQLIAAVINSSGVISDRFVFEWSGDWAKLLGNDGEKELERTLTVKVSATISGEAEPRALEVAMSQATVRNSPLWKSDPKQQLAYLAQKKWARLFAPDVILGVYSNDEFEDAPKMKEVASDGTIKPAEPKNYPAEAFDKNFDGWAERIKGGKRTPDDIIAMVESKGLLSDEQRDRILAVKSVVIDAAPLIEILDAAPVYDDSDNPF